MFLRSAQTLKNATEVVQSFFVPAIQDTIEVRKLSARQSRPHFIVVFAASVKKEDWQQIQVVTEVSYVRNRLRYATKPSKQFPELECVESQLEEKINSVIRSSMLLAAK
ncbi:hypothetical protein [Vibrio sp. AND4]|uniref:hypothetical protein n=1 Tax=Vibrio sp. AND4 TaxID=314289 RepID=UPI00015EFA4E|nr:hypothetical protein [Vibrio sp. AND4]EDP60029.1 hypothetical protein AND4_01433 [Vibrio sp. AND4]